jgi:hypothetical protein
MMRIVRSTSSHAPAGGSNETRETMRSGAIQAKGEILPDDDGVSPNPERGELVSASLNHCRRPTSQKGRSLPPTGKQRTNAPVGPIGVRGVGACQKNYHAIWETRSGRRRKRQLPLGMHNHRQCLRRESDGLVVARKRGNARGAKEPCCMHAFINEE